MVGAAHLAQADFCANASPSAARLPSARAAAPVGLCPHQDSRHASPPPSVKMASAASPSPNPNVDMPLASALLATGSSRQPPTPSSKLPTVATSRSFPDARSNSGGGWPAASTRSAQTTRATPAPPQRRRRRTRRRHATGVSGPTRAGPDTGVASTAVVMAQPVVATLSPGLDPAVSCRAVAGPSPVRRLCLR